MIPKSDSVSLEYLNNFNSRDLISIICHNCEEVFTKPKNKIVYAIKHNKILWCTSKCYTNYIISKRQEKNCSNCSKKILVKNGECRKSKSNRFFCSSSCSATFNNKLRTSNKVPKKTSDFCLYCGKPTFKSNCCSKICGQKVYIENQWKKKKEQIESFGGFEKENRPAARKYLINVYGHKCSICGINEWNNVPVPLVCDHIDGHHTNNKLDNLRMVCHNCNALLPTFGAKNKGKGRESKRLNYHKNKNKPNFRH